MKLYLESTLSEHRHGRFFVSQLGAEPTDDLPEEGLVLLHGKTFQGFGVQDKQKWWSWTSRPGCALLLIPPLNNAAIVEQTDWQVVITDSAVSSAASRDDGVIPKSVADEVNQRIDGSDGEFDRGQGHQWSDYSVNTRFVKQHSGSGVFAVTCLPLWSISLLENENETIKWLSAILALAGKYSDQFDSEPRYAEVVLEPTDYTVMVCVEAWGLKSIEDVKAALSNSKMKTITLADQAIDEGFGRLSVSGYVDENGLTESGLAELSKSPYWAYIERLREESR